MSDVGPVSSLALRTPVLLSTDHMYVDDDAGGDWRVTRAELGATIAAVGLTALLLTGNISAAWWGTSGIGLRTAARTITDTTSAGTVATPTYTNTIGGNTIAASNATTYSDYYSLFVTEPVAGSLVTFTRKWALGLTGNAAISGAVSIGGATIGTNALAVTGTINSSGTITTSGSGGVNAAAFLNTQGFLGLANFFKAVAPSAGVITFSNDGITDFARINFGGTTTAFGAVARDGAGIAIKLADNSAYANIAAAAITAMKGTAIPAGGTAGAGVLVSSATNFGVFFGSGAPSLAAAKGSFYMRSDGSGIADRAYVNTDGSTAWTAIATAA